VNTDTENTVAWHLSIEIIGTVRMSLAEYSVSNKRKQCEDVYSVVCSEVIAKNTRKTTLRAWLVKVSCKSKEDIICFDLQIRDPFQQLKASYFNNEVMIQQILVCNNQKHSKKSSVAFCFDEEGADNQQKNPVMEAICREIWPEEKRNPFEHGAFGPYILYYAGRLSGAPCVDMENVDTIDSLVKRLAASN